MSEPTVLTCAKCGEKKIVDAYVGVAAVLGGILDDHGSLEGF